MGGQNGDILSNWPFKITGSFCGDSIGNMRSQTS